MKLQEVLKENYNDKDIKSIKNDILDLHIEVKNI